MTNPKQARTPGLKRIAEPSPQPWAVIESESGGLKIVDADGEFVSFISESRYIDGRRDPIAEGNNAFIVTACNAHADLVAALRDLLALHDVKRGAHSINETILHFWSVAEKDQSRKALAQARAVLAKVQS